MDEKINRRELLGLGLKSLGALALGGAILGSPSTARAQYPGRIPDDRVKILDEDPNTFIFPRFKYLTLSNVGDKWDAGWDYDDQFLEYLQRATNIKLTRRRWQERVVKIDDFSRMYTLPFLFMTGEGDFRLSQGESSAICEFFKRGGFIYADDCVLDQSGDFFYKAFVREFQKVMPDHELKPVPHDHEIYHCYYDFPRGAPFNQGQPHPDMGLFDKERMVAFLTAGDIHCGWSNNRFWGEQRREECFRMGTNIVVYALTH